MITGIREYDSIEWIMEKSMTATQHQGKATILAWIHSHVNGRRCDEMTSKDVHRAKELEQKCATDNIQSIVVEISKSKETKYNIFRLTDIGRRRVDRCREKSNRFHKSCEQTNFFEVAEPKFLP